nr:Gag-Pol polyprotein [Tanacetum cinerariifolium]
MHADLKYVETLKKEIDELESEKAKFSDMYDVILQECVSKDVMCSYLMSLSDLDALDELQCLYLHKVKECECLAQKLLKQIQSVSKKVHTELLQHFAKVEKHLISLEIALQNSKEQFAPILGYGDLVQGNVMINKVYYIEGLNHNLFSVGQFCDAYLEVAFRKSTCFVRDLQDEVTNLQCNYLELLQKCECLEIELSKRKMMSKSFESVQKHAINLELELEQCKEKIKNDMSFKVNKSKYFCKEREQYFEIQDLKAQLQDKGIIISELKELIEKQKGKYVDTKFEKSSVIRQPNAFKSQRPSVLGKPTAFSNSFIRKDFLKSTSVTQKNVANDFSKPVTAQIFPANKKSILKNTNVLNPGMYKIHTDHTQTRTSKLPPDSKKTNKRLTFST